MNISKFVFVFIFCNSLFLYSFSQENTFDISNYKVFRIEILNVNESTESDLISRTVEKNGLCIFSAVNTDEKAGLFIVNKNSDVIEILNLISDYRFEAGRAYEVKLTDENFLDIYLKRGNRPTTEYNKRLPDYIQMGPNNDLSNSLYKLAKSVWINKYPEAYKSLMTPESELNQKTEETKTIKGY